jgi:23S rRNA pseudouridine1911/1915/1917 synthase
VNQTIELCLLDQYATLETCITELFGLSRSAVKKLKLPKQFLAKNIRAKDEISLPIDLVNSGLINPVFYGEVPTIIFEDENFIVLSKPPGVHTHPLKYSESDNIISFLASRAHCGANVNHLNMDRGALYRLDKETSGLLYIAKKNEVYETLRENFNTLVKSKVYFARVKGELTSSTLKHNLKASGPKGSKMKESEDGLDSEISVELVEYNSEIDESLLRVSLEEGRRHQIRAQLSLSGFPIIGDQFYGGGPSTRLWLHCYKYTFEFNGHVYECVDDTYLDLFLAHFNSKL